MAIATTMPKAAVQTTLRVPQDIYARMAKLAAKEGIPINTWATRAIEHEAERLERQERRAHGGSDD
jgi:predicted HicB family RNase H-like nuclease